MSCFDRIDVYMPCPYCMKMGHIECQTKDLGSRMYHYRPLRKDWETGIFGKKFHKKMPVCGSTQFDKSYKVWKSQAEQIEAMAKVPAAYKHLKSVAVSCDCTSPECSFYAARRDIINQNCVSGFGRIFYGRIRIKNGMLYGVVYAKRLTDKLTEAELSKFSDRDLRTYNLAMEKFGNEVGVVNNWYPEKYESVVEKHERKKEAEAK